MADNSTTKSFWATLPGILTGIAAIITAFAGLFIAIYSNNSTDDKSLDNTNGDTSKSIENTGLSSLNKELLPSEWPLVQEETFSDFPEGWMKGNYSDDVKGWRYECSVTNGKYRFDFESLDSRYRWVGMPYTAELDFYAAIDIRIVEFEPASISSSAGLIFGRGEKIMYNFSISENKKFSLDKIVDKDPEFLTNWTVIPFDIDPYESNRLSVIVEDQKIKLYINSKLVGTHKDIEFTGGKFGLVINHYTETSMVVDFDNFELRRRPY